MPTEERDHMFPDKRLDLLYGAQREAYACFRGPIYAPSYYADIIGAPGLGRWPAFAS